MHYVCAKTVTQPAPFRATASPDPSPLMLIFDF
jgi:hypothetical protein